jgi:hypothetical protein
MTNQLVTPPAPPANAVEARSQLATLTADREWGAKLFAGDIAANKQFEELTSKAAGVDDAKIALAMSGNIGDVPDSSIKMMASTATMLREIGIRDEVITDTLQGKEYSKTEHDLAAAWQKRHMNDREFVKRYMAGDAEAREKMTLANIILSSPIKGVMSQARW